MNNIVWSYDSIDNWYQVVDGKAGCDFCGKEGLGIYYISDEDSACLSCILDLFSEIALDKIYDTTDGHEILSAFEPGTPPPLKIGMLLNMEELLGVIENIPGKKRLHILQWIALSIGYNSPHPLSSLLRAIAVNKIILADVAFLKVLLDGIELDLTTIHPIDSQIFSYNLSLTLSYLAPYNKLVRNLIEKMVEIAKERKDTFIVNWFVLKNGYYMPNSIFFSGENDTYQLIKNFAIANEISATTSTSNNYRVKQALDEIYTLKYLKNIYNLYLHNVHRKAELTPQFLWPGNRAKKKDYVRIFSEILLNKKLSNVFLEELPDWIRTSFEELLWEDRCLPLTEFLKRGNLKIPKDNGNNYYYEPKLPPESQLFQVWVNRSYYSSRGEVFLFLDKFQTELFRSSLPVPENCKLQLKNSYSPELFIISNTEILTELQILVVYLHQVGLKRAKNGIKILKSTIKDIRKTCNIEELYSEIKGLDNIRLIMLIELVEKVLKKKTGAVQLSSDNFIKTLFSFYFNPKESVLVNFSQFLDYLKFNYIGKNRSDQDRFYQERIAIKKLLDQMVVGKWMEISNIHRYFNSKGIMPQPFNLSGSIGEIYFSTKNENSYGNTFDRVRINNANKGEALYKPYIKIIMFVLNTLGVVDLAYTMPVNNTFQDKNNPWLSVYDGIKEISLTPLGAWLLGRTKNYKGIKKEPSAKISLDNKRLIVTVEGKDPVIDLTLTRMARPLGSGSFIISSDIFLKGCETEVNIKEKIKSFKTNICKNPPQIWEDFFSSLLHKVDPLKYKKGEMLLFQLDPADKDLISLLFTDPHLKYNIMKVEDYHILIKESSYKAVRNRLLEFGYLLPKKYEK